MKILANYIKYYFAFLLIAVISGSARSQQLLQTFSESNSIGYSNFAYSVSTAGDVNNDGYSDIIVGAPDYIAYQGRAYIYYGGSPMDSNPDVILDGDSSDYFGSSVSTAGDVNNDGYSDVIVGAYGHNSYTGRAYIYYGGSPMDSTRDVILTGEGTGNWFGVSVSTAGDVNNDGYSDVIIGAPEYNSGTGRAYIYYGGSSMDNTPDVILTGEGTNNWFGVSVSSAGDVNNDGYSDVIIGANYYNTLTGRAYIYYGGGTMNSTPDVILNGEATNNRFGSSVSTAGDVNNDGYSDVIVGAFGYSSYTGRAYIYYGGSSMDNTPDVILTGEGTNNEFGSSVSTAGDVNNDRYSDIIVGAPYYNSNTGRAYIYYGGSTMDSTPDVILNGQATNHMFGSSVSTAGDVNNDGYSDVIVGSPYYNSNTGRAYIYYGGSSMNNAPVVTLTGEMTENYFGVSVSTAGDVNNDGYSDVIVGAYGYNSNTGRAYIYYGGNSMDSTPDVVLTGENTGDYFGCSVGTAGDINNDGYSDVIVGAYGYKSYTGRAYIYYGGSPMNNTPNVTLTGLQQADYFGSAVSTAGDVNNDGYSDVIVGAYLYNSYNQQYNGQAYIYYGGNPMDNAPDVTLTAPTDYFLGCSVSTAGDVNNDGYSDVIVGAYGYFTTYSPIGRAFIYYGGNPMDNKADVVLTGEGENNYFGWSVGTAGDVNNDGYSDVIVGAPGYNSGTGRAYIYYGGSAMDSTRDVILTGENTGDNFGFSVSTAGDVNNDGFSDVIVGAPYNSNTGRAYIYYGGSSMNNTPDVTLDGGNENIVFGYSVNTAGDVNNDGYSDVIVGDFGYHWNTGKAYIYTDNSALPVELSDFSANIKDDKVDLHWKTQTEVNDYGFEIQRRNSSGTLLSGNVQNDWAKVGFVKGAGNSNSPKNYSFTDQPTGGTSFSYRIKQIDNDGKLKYYDPIAIKLNPKQTTELLDNYPNPFNPSTSIKFYTPKKENITIKIYDMLGKEVNTLINKQSEAGYHIVYWNGKDNYGKAAASGVYFYRLKAGNFVQTKKMILLK